PPLPPRPKPRTDDQLLSPLEALQRSSTSKVSSLQSKATTAISFTEIQTQSVNDGLKDAHSIGTVGSTTGSLSGQSGTDTGTPNKRVGGRTTSEVDNISVRSYAPTIEGG